jgi:2-amino-4-hydroxy-6-hydroxymethyldihydropteridine diphosphokinase
MPGISAQLSQQRHQAWIGLGSNLGDRSAMIERSLSLLDGLAGVWVVRVSSVIETAPVGPAGQGPYLNAAAELATILSPAALLDAMLCVERKLGRDRSAGVRWGPRTIDLDLLLFEDRVINEPGLAVPHPRLAERAFVLGPLSEIAPLVRVPGDGRTVAALLAELLAAQVADHLDSSA